MGRWFFVFVCVLFFSFFLRPHSQAVIISEIMFNPPGNDNTDEYVELYNPNPEPFSLEGCHISDGKASNRIIPTPGQTSLEIPPYSYCVIVDPDYFDSPDPYHIPPDVTVFTITSKAFGDRGFSNSVNERVSITTANGDTLSAETYDVKCPPGHSWERIVPWLESSGFKPSLEIGGTPGLPNSVMPPKVNPALPDGSARYSPSFPEAGESFTLYLRYFNAGLESIEDVEVHLYLEPERFLGALMFKNTVSYDNWSEEIPFTVNMPLSGRVVLTAVSLHERGVLSSDDSLRIEVDIAIPIGDVLLNEIMAAPTDKLPEWIELYNRGNLEVSLYDWRVADSLDKPNAVIGETVFIAPGEYFVISGGEMEGAFSLRNFPVLNNDGDVVRIYSPYEDLLDSISWNSTKRGFSYERVSPMMDLWDYSTDPEGSTPGRINSISYKQTESKKGSLQAEPNPFSFSTNVSYTLPFPLSRVNLKVFDRKGRTVAVLRDAEDSGSEWKGEWKPEKLPSGPYILFLEALDRRTGEMLSIRKVVVFGRNF